MPDAAGRRLERERVLARVRALLDAADLVAVLVWTEAGVQVVSGDRARVHLLTSVEVAGMLSVSLEKEGE
jgi:hypothetical protein